MEKTYSCCWERISQGEALPRYPRHWGPSALVPQTESAFPFANVKSALLLTSPSLVKVCQCHLWFVLSYLREWDTQNLSVAKGNQLPESPLQAVKGSLQRAIQNWSSSEFIFSGSSCPTDCNGCLERLTPLGSYSSSQPAFPIVSKTFFFVTAKLASVGSVCFCSIQDSHPPWNNLTFFIKWNPQKQKHLHQYWKAKCCGRVSLGVQPPQCLTPHLPRTIRLKISNDHWIKLEFLQEPIFLPQG